jgi:hypothetical protein
MITHTSYFANQSDGLRAKRKQKIPRKGILIKTGPAGFGTATKRF